MNWHSLKWTLGRLFRLTQTDRDLDEEIRAHLAIDMRQRMDAGDAAETARLIVMLARERERELATAAGRKP